ncbi:hypothetical protein, partial [Methyloversatilis discipulorum]|uniref:hypothetical protein n=1 Tax=Methyloversatilis discipulorum TaxID=1119528 RepID=UPI0026F23879
EEGCTGEGRCEAGSEEGCTGEGRCEAGREACRKAGYQACCEEGGGACGDQGRCEGTGGRAGRCRKVGSARCSGAGNAVDGCYAGYQVVAESGCCMALPDGFASVLIARPASSKAAWRSLSPCRFFL